jgi:5'-deoxynucleotidase YfbR-like HD superfamily hydrolase
MQPIDVRNDPRRPRLQVASSIRAAILNGELHPGQQLPSTTELAQFFKVAPGTVTSAIQLLRNEGFLRTRPGAGIYVSDQASQPVPPGEGHELSGTATYLHEMGQLKNLPRSGWLLLGIPEAESVAEHSFRAAMVGLTLAQLEGADVARTIALCVIHDTHETRIGDVPSVGRAYVTTAAPEAVVAHQAAGMPDEMAKVVLDLVREFNAGETLEARVARDADKLETLLQAIEYRDRGHATEEWQRTSIEALRTDGAKQLAQAILNGDPHWWASFAASYHELRAAAIKRTHEAEKG